MQVHSYPRLLGDIGGTNARFAWQDQADAPLRLVTTLACADFASLNDAVQHFLYLSGTVRPRFASLGVATAVTEDWVQMTNHPWAFSITQLRSHLGVERLEVINDFTALALGLSSIAPDDLLQLGGRTPIAGQTIALLGPGTGLGVGGLVFHAGRAVALAGEGGHATLSANSALEDRFLAHWKPSGEHICAETVLSGSGLVKLYQTACDLVGRASRAVNPESVVLAALDRTDDQAVQAIHVFLSFLGGCAGNLALTLGARGGVYLGGGIVPRLQPLLADSPLRAQFDNKGRYRSYLESIPLLLICSAVSPALQGASRALD